MSFRCPLCGSTSFGPVTVRRRDGSLYLSSLRQCAGCSIVFTDPERLSKSEPPPTPAAPPLPPDFRSLWQTPKRESGDS